MPKLKSIKMTVKSWTHENINKNGIKKSGGRINTKKGIYSSELHACTLPFCKCIKGDWVSINFGYDAKKKAVSGITFYFDNTIEFDEFLEKLEPISELYQP